MMYTIKGVKLDIDMDEADFIDKYESAHNAAKEETKDIGKLTGSAAIRKNCEVIHNIFDAIFGEGTSEKMFQKKYNQREAEEAYYTFLKICNEQMENAAKRRAMFIGGKFLPQD